ncbi:hypothetical protein ART_1696 [Arthrobacter sp. PAMC 25486]|uniref:Rv3235 family protein n=1 Tax=Arthrobacter sp. PAMC 25486 TaxID=1494608 RepID=UPI000535BDBD|nr:Rv3235 family protein [Arthrobacter sp. PAMC 25486]AIY01295.1 hypothetical protein ART_1696 [Arthrobacter sp. PAMC 25486]
MSTAATSEGGLSTLLVIKPVTPPDIESAPEGNLVRLPQAAERVQRLQGGTSPARQGKAGSGRRTTGTVRRTAGKVAALDPGAVDQEIVELMSSRVAQAVLEVITGARSIQQLVRWLDTRCLSALTTRARLHAEAYKAASRRQSHDGDAENVSTLHHQPMVHSVHCSNVAPGIYETSVVMADATRFRAVAMRFEVNRGLWKVTALNIG